MSKKSGLNREKLYRQVLSRRRQRGIGLAAVIVLLGLFLAGRMGLLPEAAQGDRGRYHNKIFRVAKVVDGDTLDLDVPDRGKRYTRVRLWGVDTPETKHPELGVMYYGPEAAEFTRQMVLNNEVLVVLEPFEDTRDKYQRLLAYIYLEVRSQKPEVRSQEAEGRREEGETEAGGTLAVQDAGKMPAVRSEEAGGTPAVQIMLNEELIRLGYGYADDRFKHMFRDRFVKLQKEAQAKGRGLWANVKPQQWPQWYQKRQDK